MKKIKLLTLLLTAGVCSLISSCETNEPITNNVITIEGGGAVVIGETDITKEFIVKSDIVVTEDVIIALTTDATGGEATLSQDKITIKKGETEAKASITFNAAKFTEETPAKNILVSAGSLSITYTVTVNAGGGAKKLCEIDFAFTNYVVARWFSIGQYTNPEHKVEASSQGKYTYQDKTISNTVDVSEGDAISITMANINSNGTDNYTVTAWVDWNQDGNLSKAENVMSKMIVAGEYYTTKEPVIEKLKAPTGTVDGIYYMRIGVLNDTGMTDGCGASENGDVTDIAINYKSSPVTEKAILAIKPLDPATFEVTEQDYICRINLSLNKVQSQEVSVQLNATSSTALNGTLKASTVVFAPGELSKTVTMTFAANDFLTPNEKAVVTITPICAAVDINQMYKNIVLNASGINRTRLSALYYTEWETFDGAIVIENQPNIEHTLKVVIKTKDNAKATSKIVFKEKITGINANEYIIDATNNTIAIEVGKSEASFILYVRSRAIGKTMTLTLESQDADIIEEQKPIVIEILDELPAPILQDVKLTISINNSKTMTSFINMATVLFEATNGTIPRLVTITPTTTGDITASDFSFVFSTAGKPQIISANKNSIRLRFNESIKGKTGTISFTSPYASFASDGFITVNIPK